MTPVLVALLSLAAHDGSQSTSQFTFLSNGEVSVRIDVNAVDVAELCNVSSAARADRDRRDADLDTCLRRGFPFWLKFTDLTRDTAPSCHVEFLDWRALSDGTDAVLRLSAAGKCASLPRRFAVDWGLFMAHDHTSVATLIVPQQPPRLLLFSQRARKVIVELPSPWPWRTIVVMSVVCVIVALGAALARARRRRHGAAPHR